MPLTVGFDLDMTLIDPRPGMAAVLDAVAAESGHPLDGARFAANLGPPLDMVYRGFGVPEEEIPRLVDRFRALYPEVVIPATVALPGAAQALAAVRELGGTTLVVTGKYRPNAARCSAAFLRYLPVTTSVVPPSSRTAASACAAPGSATVAGITTSGYSARNRSTRAGTSSSGTPKPR